MRLEVQNCSKRFHVRGATVPALSDISFLIKEGESVSLVGGSGSGKTTLAKIIGGLFPADSGQILWEGKPQSQFSQKAWARHLQMVFQDPFASLNPKLSIRTQLEEVLRLTRSANARETAVALLESVGLSAEALPRYPFQFSGGQRQRIAIARALALRPPLLIADEPLSALDQDTQDQIVTLFQTLQKSAGLTLLLITHDLSLAQRLTQRVIVLESGRVVEEGPVNTVLSHPQHAYTRALVEAVPG